MADKEFNQFRARRETFIRGLDGVEAFILLFAFMWALEIIFLPKWTTSDPICNALQSWLPWFPVRLHGWGLLTVCILHGFGSRWKWPDLRALCIAGETMFFLYAYWSIVLTGFYLAGLFVLPVVILFSSLNFATLLRPEVLRWARAKKRAGSR